MAEPDARPRGLRRKKRPVGPIPATYTREDVEALNHSNGGWDTAYNLIRNHGIAKNDDMRTLEEFKQLLLNHLEPQRNVDGPSGFEKTAAVIKQKRDDTAKVYGTLEEFISILDRAAERPGSVEEQQVKIVRQAISKRPKCADWITNLRKNLKELNQGACPVLVAGEFGAGKSSFINLLIGEDILPVDAALCTTSCICEIHHSDHKKLFAYCSLADTALINRDVDYEDADHKEDLNGKSLEQVQDIVDHYMHEDRDKTGGPAYQRVILQWPIPFLQGGLYLVDSPGLGESNAMSDRVKTYMKEAVAFVYLLNSQAAGGFTTDGRLSELLAMNTSQVDEAMLKTFDARSAIFIFNKWDAISDNTKELIKKDIVVKLQERWPKMVPDKQIHYLSVKVARNCIKQNAGAPQGYQDFLKVFYAFLENGLEVMIKHHLKWLDHLLNNMETCVQVPLSMAKCEGRFNHQRIQRISDSLRRLQSESDEIVAKLYKDLEEKKKEIVSHLCAHLKNEETFKRMKQDALKSDLPDESDMNLNKALGRDIIRGLLLNETACWEAQTHMFSQAKESIRQSLLTEFEEMGKKLEAVEGEMKGGVVVYRPASSDHKPKGFIASKIDHVFTGPEKLVMGLTSPLWIPLAAVAGLLMTPIVGTYTLFSQIAAKYRLGNFRKDRANAMERWLRKMTNNLTEDGVRRDVVEAEMQDIKSLIKYFQEEIPALIKSNQDLLRSARDIQSQSKRILKVYNPLRQKLVEAFGLRNMYYYTYQLSQATVEDVDQDEDNTSDSKKKVYPVYTNCDMIKDLKKLASGTFADVYSGFMDQRTIVEGMAHCVALNGRFVALKKFKAVVDEHSITDMLTERDILCSLSQHQNIVQMLATVCTHDEENNKRLMFILELCDGTLKQAIFQHVERIPGRLTDDTARRSAFIFISDKLSQVARALNYLHQNDYVHRDLKLDNVLVKGPEHTVKLCDLGQYKIGKDAHSTEYVGTLKYTDPSILKDQYVESEADVYSLAMLLWEAWFGQEVWEDCDIDEEFTKRVIDGDRPSLTPAGLVPPFKDYIELITECWKKEFFGRPTADEVETVLMNMKEFVELEVEKDVWRRMRFTRKFKSGKSRSILSTTPPEFDPNKSFDSVDSVDRRSPRPTDLGPYIPRPFPGKVRAASAVDPATSGAKLDVNADDLSRTWAGKRAEPTAREQAKPTTIMIDVPYDNPLERSSQFYCSLDP